MSYQVIARKWRPQTFEEVTGQEAITLTLKNAIKYDRLHHSYIFSGSRGIGKTTTARLLAKALNCQNSEKPTTEFCGSEDQCESCFEITRGSSVDVREIDAAQNSGVDNVREDIIAGIEVAPARDRYKVFIIDEVHSLSPAAFNALLKTIEEPPPNRMFILATTLKNKIPETILSRSQQFQFRNISVSKIQERLRLIATSEQINVDDSALREIARSGEGSMRDAQSSFDQVISFAGSEINHGDVEVALGLAGADILTSVMDAISEHRPIKIMELMEEMVSKGIDLSSFCRDLLTHFRDLLVMKISGSKELLESSTCTREELTRQAKLFSESDLIRFFHSLAETETKLRTATRPRYRLEIGLAELMEMRRLKSLTELAAQVADLARR